MSEPRIGDAERDVAVAHLREAYAEGRLDQSEFEERLRVATRAKVASDLKPILGDLPNAPIPAPPKPKKVRPQVTPLNREFWIRTGAGPVLTGAIVCTAIYAMTNLGGYFWPMWVWLGVLVTVLLGYLNAD